MSSTAAWIIHDDDRLASWVLEVTDPAPERDLGELAEWAADVVDQGATE
jgi:hypothetical protein